MISGVVVGWLVGRSLISEIAAEQSLAPDRAAILVLRDTAPRQAARQVKAIVELNRSAVVVAGCSFAERLPSSHF